MAKPNEGADASAEYEYFLKKLTEAVEKINFELERDRQKRCFHSMVVFSDGQIATKRHPKKPDYSPTKMISQSVEGATVVQVFTIFPKYIYYSVMQESDNNKIMAKKIMDEVWPSITVSKTLRNTMFFKA